MNKKAGSQIFVNRLFILISSDVRHLLPGEYS